MNEELSKSLDQLNALLAQAEKGLAEQRFGVRARVLLDRTPMCVHPRYFVASYLAFGKLASEWRLILETHAERGVTQSPLVNASIEYRVLAAKHLDALLEALHLAVSDMVTSAQESIEQVTAFLGKVK